MSFVTHDSYLYYKLKPAVQQKTPCRVTLIHVAPPFNAEGKQRVARVTRTNIFQ